MDTSVVTKAPFGAFFAENKGLAHKVARKVHLRMLAMGAGCEYEDVYQEAVIVMMKAYDGFNPALGFKFSTYYMRAAYYMLNRFVESHEKHLVETTIEVATGDGDESVDLLSLIDGGAGTPEQELETKQLLDEINERLSPVARTIVEAIIEPPEPMLEEWKRVRSVSNRVSNEMPTGFVCDYLHKITQIPLVEFRAAMTEINALRKELHAG